MALFGIGTSEPKSDTQTTTVSNQTPNYLSSVANLTAVEVPLQYVKNSKKLAILHNFTLSRGRVTAIFQLPDYKDENNWYFFKEARTVAGVQNTNDLQMEFIKFVYSNAFETLSHLSPAMAKTRELLHSRGFTDEYFETTYKSDPMVNKMYYIIRDAGLLEEFKSASYDFRHFLGRELLVAWSSNGNLMSPNGEENKTKSSSIPASDTVVSTADYEATKETFDL